MRFTIKNNKPKPNERRVVRKFAFFPKRIKNEGYIWLEFYLSEQVWYDRGYYGKSWYEERRDYVKSNS